MEAAGILRAELGDGLLHPLQIRRSHQLSARAEDQAVMGIQPVHRDFFIEVSAGGGENLAQHFGVEKKSWPGIEFETVPFHGGGAAANHFSPFHDGDVDTRPGQQNSSSQATWTGPDNNDFLFWLNHSGLIGRDARLIRNRVSPCTYRQ